MNSIKKKKDCVTEIILHTRNKILRVSALRQNRKYLCQHDKYISEIICIRRSIVYLLSTSISLRKSLHTGVVVPSDNIFFISFDNSWLLLLLKNSDTFSFPMELVFDNVYDNSELPE